MGQALQIIKPIEGINTDIASKYLKGTQTRYALNLERTINLDGKGGIGYNSTVNTPANANMLVDYPQPAGDNFPIGRYTSKRTNEVYVWVHNIPPLITQPPQHHIYRINQDNTIDIILQDPLLNFSRDPRYRIRHAHLFFNHNSFFDQNNKLIRKYLVWVAGDNWQGLLDTETSLATNSFDAVTYPYFACNDRTQLWQLATRPPLICPYGAYDTTVYPDLQNLVKDQGWQFRTMFIYTDARPTAWSPISEMFFENSTCKGALQPRCINLRLDAGGPHVEKVKLAYRNCTGGDTTQQDPEWFETVILDKYAPCLNSIMPFYNRTINPDLNYDAATNTFGYQFCAEGTCLPLDRVETNKNFIAIPHRSFACAPMENKVQLINNIEGEDPVDCNELAKITFTETDRNNADCEPEMCTVRVAIIVHNFFNSMNQPVYINEDSFDMDGKKRYFGGLRRHGGLVGTVGVTSADPGTYHQQLADTTKDSGFIIYVEGSNAFGRTKQYQDVKGVRTEHIVNNFIDKGTRDSETARLDANNYYYIQIADISVVKGTKGFMRVASHEALSSDNFRNTSTTIMGVLNPAIPYYSTALINGSNCDFSQREIYFDTYGTGFLDLSHSSFILCDLALPDEKTQARPYSIGITGYLTDTENRPVAGASCTVTGQQYFTMVSPVTDHNGYFFSTFGYDTARMRTPSVLLWTEGVGCTLNNSAEAKGAGIVYNHFDRLVVDTPADYDTNYLFPVTVTLKDKNGFPLVGVGIVIEGAKGQETNDNGDATFLLRRYMLDYVDGAGGEPRVLQIVVMQSGICYMTTGKYGIPCDPHMPGGTVVVPGCLEAPVTPPPPIDLSFADLEVGELDYGYHPGGIYPMAIKLMDPAGRETAAQKCGSITLKSIQQKQQYTFSDINFNLNGFTAPVEYTKMAILIGINRAFDDFVSWVVDDVQFVDSSGTAATSIGAAKILLSIRSLYDAANIYAFGTNVRYAWVKGDRMEIIAGADGKIYTTVLQYNIEADYNNMDAVLQADEDRVNQLVIEYTKDLADLKEGAQIKIIRHGACLPAELYYETCQTIDLVNGIPQTTTGIVGGWDTYFVRRGIRWDDMTHEFPFPFLHHSPSDFWGDHCVSRGRVSAVNVYEKRLQFGRKMRLSNSFLENSNYNGLNVYEAEQVKTFSGEQRGDIVFVVSMEQLFMLIFEHDNGIVNSANEFVRVNPQNGQVVALPPDSLVSDTQSKIIGNYGCAYEDTGSVVQGDGWVFWVDTYNKKPVIHDWNEAQDASVHPQDGSQTKGYWKKKLRGNKRNIVAGYDAVSGNVMITFFGDKNYVHNNREFVWDANETIAFSVIDRRWPTAYSFTPEDYACFPGNDEGDIFITFKGAKPYLHRIMSNTAFNTFFGISVDEVFEFVINESPEKVKGFIAFQQQTEHGWYADRIISSLGHTSILPPAFVKKKTEGKFDCHFLMASNRQGGLHNGPQLRGNWLQVRVVRDSSIGNDPNNVDPALQAMYSELDRFIARFQLSEQSAYNTNNQP